MRRNNLVLLCCSLLLIFSSCQKELDNTSIPAFCGVSSITVKDGGGNALALYQYTYDSVLGRATVLHMEDFDQGTSKTVFPVYKQDTVFLGLNSYLTLDPTKRIRLLRELEAAQGLTNGDYHFSYNTTGQISDRLIDDGLNDAIRTGYSYSGNNLSSIEDDLPGYPQAVSTNVTYGSSPEIKGYSQYQLLEFFPELLLYMPALQLGKTAALPISSVKSDITVPGFPTVSITTTYSKYTLTQEGWLSSYETSTLIPGSPAIVTRYELQYRCYN